jgi:transposase InsO family protein
MAVRLRQPPEGCLFHSDRGSQYCSYDYQKKLQAYGLRPAAINEWKGQLL